MAKMNPQHVYRADGTKAIASYKVSLAKVPTEQAGFTKDTECEIEYKKNKIIITKKEN